MDPVSFPAAIVAAWIIFGFCITGYNIDRKHRRTGEEPKSASVWTFAFIAVGALAWFSEQFENPFFYNLTSDLIGGLIGLVSAYFAVRIGAALLQGRKR